MKLIILTAIIAAVASSPVSQGQQWPWQTGKVYTYEVDSYTWSKFEQDTSNGNSLKAKFVVRVTAPGRLLAKLENPQYGQLVDYVLYSDVKYQPIQKLDEPFEVLVDGGRVLSINFPSTFSVAHENLIKGFLSALQVDLSAYGHVHNYPNSYDEKAFQGLFKKMEVDVTGDCETLYTVSPVSAQWRLELPKFASKDLDLIEIGKSRDYGTCNERASLEVGVPEGAVWQGIAVDSDEKQFIKHTSESRIFAGKEGTIYKADVFSSVFVAPQLIGKQKAEVYSYVQCVLSSVEEASGAEWQLSGKLNSVKSLLYTIVDTSYFAEGDDKAVVDAQNLLQKLTPMLQDLDNLPKADFLTKYTTLIRLLSRMNAAHLDQMTNSVEVARESTNAAKYNMWIIYRDALAQAGSIASFHQIKSWILTKKVKGEEAAELVSSIPNSLRYASNEIMEEFFNFALSPVVLEQKFLNTTALLAAVKVFRYSKDESFISANVIPRLSTELKSAIKKSDSKNAQVYITVLGNLAHTEVLDVFAPYLEGKIPVSKYLRVTMVNSLKKLANMKNSYVRAVLFSILRNTAEPYEIRVAAALHIFLAVPDFEMMQVMAHMTNDDPSTQVRAVLSNSIAFAAKLQDPRFAELAKYAKAVQSFVNKNKYGYRYSTDSMVDLYTGDDDTTFFRQLAFIGSEDHSLPLYQYSGLRAQSTAWTEEEYVIYSVSNMKQFQKYFEQFAVPANTADGPEFKFSAKKIAELLSLKQSPRPALEGSFFLDKWQQERLITFSEEDLNSFVKDASKRFEQFFSGTNGRYIKLMNQKQVWLTFPLAMGVPFVYDYSEPMLFSFEGEVKFEKASQGYPELKTSLSFTYAKNTDGRVGFLDTIGNVYANTGVISKFQVHIPAKISASYSNSDIKLKITMPEEDTVLAHQSIWPYSTLHKIDFVSDIFGDPSTKLIERSANLKVDESFKFGDMFGMVFQAEGYSYSADFKDSKGFTNTDPWTDIYRAVHPQDLALTTYDLKYVAKESKNKYFTFSSFFKTFFNLNEAGELGKAVIYDNATIYSDSRRETLAKKVAAGIKSANVEVMDFEVGFGGEEKAEYSLTYAFAESYVDRVAQVGFIFNGLAQLNGVFKTNKPKAFPLNLEEALKSDVKTEFEGHINVADRIHFDYKGYGERTEEYTEILRNDPMAKQCFKDISKEDVYQLDCYKMLMKAHAPDYYKETLTYNSITPSDLAAARYIFNYIKEFSSWDEEENPLETVPEGTIEIESRMLYDQALVNYKFSTKYGSIMLNNVEGMAYYAYQFAYYDPLGHWEMSRNWFTGYQNLPYCAVDSNKVYTYSGRSYDYSLSGSWHVVMVDQSGLVILARRPSKNQAEVYIAYNDPNGNYLEVDIKPSNVEVKSNGKKTSTGTLTAYWDETEDMPLLEYYELAKGVQVFNIHDKAIRMMYDGQRVILFTAQYRATTSGICGMSTGQTSADFLTPWGLVSEPELYGASYSLDGEFSDPKTAALKKEAKLKAYQPATTFTTILRSDGEWTKAMNKSVKSR